MPINKIKKSGVTKILKKFYVFFIVIFISGCTNRLKYHDPYLRMSEDEIKAKLGPDTTKTITTPAPPLKKRETLFSLSSNGSIPLRTLLSGLAIQKGIGLSMPDEGLEKGVSIRLVNQPLGLIVQHLCRAGNLRYTFEDNMLTVAKDEAYLKTYDIQFLVGSRKTQNNMSVSTSLHQTGTSNPSASSTTISSSSEVDFWGEIDKTVKQILLIGRVKDGKKGAQASSYTFHKQAGLLSVHCKQEQHNIIASYLKRIKNIIHTQVLIEAKIVEVHLNEDFESGINWDYLSKRLGNTGVCGNNVTRIALGGANLTIKGAGLNAAIQLMENFGTVQTIANPRLTVLNNQSAVFKAAENAVYFTLATEHVFTSQNKPHMETVSSQVQTIPIGLLMTVQPSIDFKSENITLFIKPAISRVSRFKEDPAVSIKSNGKIKSEVPVVQVREMDSMVTLKPGEIVIMGGLIEKESSGLSSGLPGVRKTLLNNLTGHRKQRANASELVIFLTARLQKQSDLNSKEAMFYKEL